MEIRDSGVRRESLDFHFVTDRTSLAALPLLFGGELEA
jgi:hypothetical protein